MGNEISADDPENLGPIKPPISDFIFKIDGYQVEKQISQNSLGIITRFQNQKEKRSIIGKTIYSDLSHYSNLTLFFDQIQTLSTLFYPTLLPFAGFVVSNPLADFRPTIFYEDYATGFRLTDLIKLEAAGKAPPEWNMSKKIETIYSLLSSIKFLHRNEIIHGGLNTDCIVFSSDFMPLLTDFSYNSFFSAEHMNAMTNDVNTDLCRAPELDSLSKKTKKSDVYSAAMIIFQIFTVNTSDMLLKQFPELWKVIKESNRPKIPQEVPESMKKLIHNCWAPNPNDRWTAQAMLNYFQSNSEQIAGIDDKQILKFKKIFNSRSALLQKIKEFYFLSEKGDPQAQYNYGLTLYNGQGIAKNIYTATKYFKMAAEQRYAEGMHHYGHALENGIGVDQDLQEAARYYKMASDLGFKNSQFAYAQLLYKGSGVKRNPTEAAKFYRMAAVQGHPAANYRLGLQYEYGEGVQKDKSLAFKYFKESASQMFPPGMYKYGLFIITGKDPQKSPAEGLKNIADAAKEGYPRAYCFLGALSLSGQYIKKSAQVARKQFFKGAQEGEPAGYFGLAVSDLIDGEPEAFENLRKSAENGYIDAERIYAQLVTDPNEKKKYLQSAKTGGNQKAVVLPLKVLLKGSSIPPTIDGVVQAFRNLQTKTKHDSHEEKEE